MNATLVRLRGELARMDFEIPGGNVPVHIARLSADDGARSPTLFVRFPPGWERPAAGSYAAEEEFVLLDGALEMTGVTYRPGDWAVIPAGVERSGSATPDGALALARFGGPARWRAGEGTAAVVRPTPLLGEVPATGPSPFGAGEAVRLHDAGAAISWLLFEGPPLRPVAFHAELLSIESRTWAWVPAGSAVPQLDGRCFCRTFVPEAG